MSDLVTITKVDGVADVRLNRPDKYNALSPEMFEAIVEAGESLLDAKDVRVVVLSGNGRGFCAGLDFSSFQGMAGSTERRPQANTANLFERSDDQPENPEPHPVNQFQVATRLSYFLWSSCPDERLLNLAETGKLAAGLDAEVRRMLQDRRADALVDNFAMQWLQLGRLAGHSSDPKTFPKWSPATRAAMLEETRRFLVEIARSDRSILDLLDGEFTWVNRELADIYGIQSAGPFNGKEWKIYE